MISHYLHPGDWRGLLPLVDRVDALIVDAPYSKTTHGGHDRAPTVHGSRRSGTFTRSNGYEYERRAIGYDGWSPADVRTFVSAWEPKVSGWFCSMTDDILAPVWRAALRRSGRMTFALIPCVGINSRIRLQGDGPSSWSCYLVVARPRAGEHRSGLAWPRWGTLPGAYTWRGAVGKGAGDATFVVGAKPLSLLHDLIRDYTMPGDVVCDPCAGGGTTLCAALDRGRFAIGAEVDPDTHAQALARIERHRVRAERMTAHELRRHDRPDRVEQLAQRAAARGATVAEQAALPLGG